MANEPEGWNIPVDTYASEEELIKLVKGYDVIRHTNKEEEYDYMYDEDITLEVVNPDKIENLYIEISDEYTIFYGPWHTHYFSYEYDYKMMKNVIKNIMNNKFGAYGVYKNDNCLMGNIVEKSKEEFDPTEVLKKINKELIEQYKVLNENESNLEQKLLKELTKDIKNNIKDTQKILKKEKIILKVVYWNEVLEYEFIDGKFIGYK